MDGPSAFTEPESGNPQQNRKDDLVTYALNFEHSSRKCLISKARPAYRMYLDSIFLYAMSAITNALKTGLVASVAELAGMLKFTQQRRKFTNIGGQLIPEHEYETLLKRISEYEIVNWEQVHDFYREQALQYPQQKLAHAIACLQFMEVTQDCTKEKVQMLLRKFLELKKEMLHAIRQSRKKDYTNRFRQMLYASEEEMYAVTGKPENSFVQMQEAEYHNLETYLKSLIG